MKIIKVVQGSDDWLSLRSKYSTASEAPVMMAASPKIKRNELLEMKALGTEKEFSDWVQRNLFDKGHEFEALARPIVEKIVGEELYPITGICKCDKYLASFDGLDMMGEVVFEHKMWNEQLAEKVRDGKLDPEYYWQLEHQLMVSEAEKAIFVVSDGTEENMVYMWYTPVRGRRKKLIAGWEQFHADLAEFKPVEKVAPVVGEKPTELPALLIQVEGQVTSSNLATFKDVALDFIKNINTDLQSDQDFANAEEMVKFCKTSEEQLEAAKKHALAQTQSIDRLFRTVDELRSQLRDKRLMLEKLVKSRKDDIRGELRTSGIERVQQYVDGLNERLGQSYIAHADVIPDFGVAMKAKKTVETLRSAVDDAVAAAKIEASEIFERMQANLVTFEQLVESELRPVLFTDLSSLVGKDADSFKGIVKSRLADYREAEAQRKAKADAEQQQAAAKSTTDESPKSMLRIDGDIHYTSGDGLISSPGDVNVTNPGNIEAIKNATPPVPMMLQAICDQFHVSRDVALVFICETADTIRGADKQVGRLGKAAKGFGDEILNATSDDSLLFIGRRIQTAKDKGDINDVDHAWLESQYRSKKTELRA